MIRKFYENVNKSQHFKYSFVVGFRYQVVYFNLYQLFEDKLKK